MHRKGTVCCAFVFFYMLIYQITDSATVCGNGYKGENDPQSKNNHVDSITGLSYQMTSSQYTFDCCGVIDQWQAYLGNNGTIIYQVWRLTSGTTYKLVGENSYTATSRAELTATIPTGQQITVLPGDYIGWWTSGVDLVYYKLGSGEENGNLYQTTTDLSVGATLNWTSSSVTTRNDRSYAIGADYAANSAPNFTNLPATVSITNAKTAGYLLHTLSFTDSNPYDVSGLAVTRQTTNTYFSFDATSYQVTVASSLSGAVGTHPLVFHVADICPQTGTGTLTIVVSNVPPTIHNLPATTDLSEDVITESLIYSINVSDPTETVTCSLATTNVSFLVKLKNGTSDWGLYVQSNPKFNYDTRNQYSLSISCTDGIDTVNSTFTVYLLRNSPPVITNLANSVSVATTATSGYTVFTVTATDAENDQLFFNMTCNKAVCPFQILDSGIIQLTADLKSSTTPGYDLSVYVYDGTSLVGPRVLTVTISGINSKPIISNLPLSSALSVPENTALRTSVFTVSVSDADIEDTHTFTMTSSPGTGMNHFFINTSTGVVSTANNIIDYETAPSKSFNFTVTMTDGKDSDINTLQIGLSNVNEAPSFSQTLYSISASEAMAGTALPDPGFASSDPDSNDTHQYSQNCGNATGYFRMASATGRMNFSVDYDVDSLLFPTSIVCIVTVTDAGGLTGTTSLSIRISDINDNVPVFIPSTYSFFVSYYAGTATVIGIVNVSDADVGTYGTVTLTLNQTSLGAAYFGITSRGSIYTQRSVSPLGSGSTILIQVLATDGGGVVTTATVTVVVSDTTTVSTTTVATGYKTLLQDGRNIAWISVSSIIGLVIIGVLIWFLCEINRKGAPKLTFRQCFGRQRKTHTIKHQKPEQMPREPERSENSVRVWRDLYERHNQNSGRTHLG
ncbi:hypothetical protein CHS0354_024311 [Potamilus streckersoni]|uniref:Cadherin domain-containing protein n=1 Tax=Potamilus streckersoni TaxID=2493646 RepID=A0AAE0RNI7_9BIVA|nr:hypothetical protein CHS0354_024311 [Potamilus streckersoni]